MTETNGFFGLTGGEARVTGGGDAPRSPGAIRQARYKERRREQARLAAQVVEESVQEARQERLPLAPVGELEAEPVGVLLEGRPAGSVARSTAEWQRFVLARYRSPLIGLAEIASRPARDLALEVGCTPHEALLLQLRAMESLAPYIHSKMPTALQVEGAPVVPMVIAVSPEMAARMGVQDQQVSGDAAP
jgi:hypothetical protein